MTVLWIVGLYLAARAGWERTRQRLGTRDELAALGAGLVWMVMILLVALPALGHSRDEIDVWEADWLYRVEQETALTPDLVAEWMDFQARHTPIMLPVERRTSTGLTADEWKPLVEQFFTPDDVQTALRVIWCESRGDPNAKNPVSTASGLWQFLRGWWGGEWGPAFDPFDPVESTRRAAELRYSRGSWADWNASKGCWG